MSAGVGTDLPYRLRAQISAELGGTPFRTNRFGVRGQEIRIEPRRDRILVLGDSVVFGLAVSDEETFPVMLQRELAALGRTNVDAINAGVPGYNIAAEAALFHVLAPVLKPREVLIGVSLNDFGEAPRLNALGVLTQRPAAESPGWLARNSEFYLALDWGWRAWRSGSLSHLFADESEEQQVIEALDALVEHGHRKFYSGPKLARWERVRRSLIKARDSVRSLNLPLTVVIFPEAYQFASPHFRVPQEHWLALTNELGIRAIDLWPVFNTAMEQGAGNLFRDNQHPNAAGLAVAARAVARQMVRGAAPGGA